HDRAGNPGAGRGFGNRRIERGKIGSVTDFVERGGGDEAALVGGVRSQAEVAVLIEREGARSLRVRLFLEGVGIQGRFELAAVREPGIEVGLGQIPVCRDTRASGGERGSHVRKLRDHQIGDAGGQGGGGRLGGRAAFIERGGYAIGRQRIGGNAAAEHAVRYERRAVGGGGERLLRIATARQAKR